MTLTVSASDAAEGQYWRSAFCYCNNNIFFRLTLNIGFTTSSMRNIAKNKNYL